MRTPTLIATLLAASFLAGPVTAQMAPGTRAGDAPGMGSIGGQLEGQRLGPPARLMLPVPTVRPEGTPAPSASGMAAPTTPGIAVAPAGSAPSAPAAAGTAMPTPAAPAAAPTAPSGSAPSTSGSGAAAPSMPGAAAPNTSGMAAPAAPSGAAAPPSTPGSPQPSTSGEPLAPPRADPVPSGPGITEQQARTQLSGAGYTEVLDLQRGENGAWRGRAVRDGQSVNVTIGTDGEVTTTE